MSHAARTLVNDFQSLSQIISCARTAMYVSYSDPYSLMRFWKAICNVLLSALALRT